MRELGIKQGIESLDEAVDFYLETAGPHHRAINGGVEGRSITPGGQDADPLHALRFYTKPGSRANSQTYPFRITG